MNITIQYNSPPPFLRILVRASYLTLLLAIVNLIFSLSMPLMWIFFPTWGMALLLFILKMVEVAIRRLDSFVGYISRTKTEKNR
jgi:hypothetical protein